MPKAKSKAKITDKQKAFCREYVKDFNTGKAMITAGYSKSYSTAQSKRMLEDVGVRAEIEKYVNRADNDVDKIRKEIVDKTRAMMNADILDLYDSVHGELIVKNLTEVPRGVRDLIQEIQTINLPDGGGLGCKIKLIPRDRIISLGAKMAGMLIDKHEVKVDQTISLVECNREIDEREKQNKVEAGSVSD